MGCGGSKEALLDATRAKDFEEVQRLLAAGIDVNQTDEAQWTALHVICCAHVHKLTQDALKDAADEEKADVIKEILDILHALIDAGADVTAQSRSNATPLHEAAFNDFIQAAEILLENNADVSAVNFGGRTAMHLAAEQGNLEVLRMLCKADKNGHCMRMKDKGGATAFDMGSDSAKEVLNEFGYGGAMDDTVESRDAAFMEELQRTGKLDTAAVSEMQAESNGRRTAANEVSNQNKRAGVLTFSVGKRNGKMEVCIKKGVKLTDKDLVGNNDVYVVVQCNYTDVQRTKTIPDAGADPVWEFGKGQTLTFDDVSNLSSLNLYVFDEDFGGASTDDLIGKHSVPEKSLLAWKEDDWSIRECDAIIREDEELGKTMKKQPLVTTEKYLVDGKDPNASSGGGRGD